MAAVGPVQRQNAAEQRVRSTTRTPPGGSPSGEQLSHSFCVAGVSHRLDLICEKRDCKNESWNHLATLAKAIDFHAKFTQRLPRQSIFTRSSRSTIGGLGAILDEMAGSLPSYRRASDGCSASPLEVPWRAQWARRCLDCGPSAETRRSRSARACDDPSRCDKRWATVPPAPAAACSLTRFGRAASHRKCSWTGLWRPHRRAVRRSRRWALDDTNSSATTVPIR